jgi:hypothetical protein
MFQNTLGLLLQLSLVALASAAPIAAQSHGNWQYGAGGGVVGFIVLILDIIVFSTYPTWNHRRCFFSVAVTVTSRVLPR